MEDIPPVKKLVVDSAIFNELITALVQTIEEGADSVEICIDERDLDCGLKCQVKVKVEVSDELGEFDSDLSQSSLYSCIHAEH